MIRGILKRILWICKFILKRFGYTIISEIMHIEPDRKPKLNIKERDFIRYSLLHLISLEITEKRIAGDVAELGVFRGYFARHISQMFPNLTLYLFDTFEGFDNRDIDIELEGDYSKIPFDLSDTNVSRVLRTIQRPEKCRIVKGYFPESLTTLSNAKELCFAFVSIDTDLYKPTYEGLCYFYQRLSEGGFILVHDYNNRLWNGVKKAVEQFSKETGAMYIPLPDLDGSVCFVKPKRGRTL